MPSTYTLNNGIELIATGEQSGTWGDTTNVNLGLIDTALDGQVTVTLPAAGTSGSPNALPISDGSASNGRNRLIIFDDGGDLGATAFVQLTPNDAEKIVYIRNNLSGGRAITLFQGTYNASNDYEVPAGTTAVVFFNGGGAGAVAANVFNNAFFDSLRLGGVSVTAILDEDNMASDSATALATQQSIKAYVDAQVTAQDLDFAGDTGTGAVDLDSQTFAISGTANEIETSASGQTITVGLPNAVTIASLTATTADINGGTIDGTVIGGSTPAAISGTTGSFSGTVGVDRLNVYGASFSEIYFDSGQGAISYDNANDAQRFYTNSTERMRITSTGDVGIGVIPESWSNGGGNPNFAPLQLGSAAALSGSDALNFMSLSANAYRASTGWRYINTEAASLYTQDQGSHIWYNAASGAADAAISWSERLRITSAGSVGIGTSSPAAKLDVSSGSVVVSENTNQTSFNRSIFAEYPTAASTSVNNVFSVGSRKNSVFPDRGASVKFVQSGTTNASAELASSIQFWTWNLGVDNGAERMRIDSSGRVGIGTSSPATTLDVRGSTAATIRVGSTSNGGGGDEFGNLEFYWGDEDAAEVKAKIYAKNVGNVGPGGGGAADLLFATTPAYGSSTERMRIDASGNVGIGVVPSAWGTTNRVLQVAGAALSRSDFVDARLNLSNNAYHDNAGNWFYIASFAASRYQQGFGSPEHVWFTAPSGTAGGALTWQERMRIDASGFVGIGTSSPAYKLDINTVGGAAATARLNGNDQSNVRLRFENGGSGGRTWELVGGLPGANNANFSIFDATGSTTPLTIDASGNVGIGMSSPRSLLDVVSSAADATLNLDGANSGGAAYINFRTSGTNRAYVGTGALTGGSNNDLVSWVSGAANSIFYTNSTERMRIDSSGNVGIGTTSPSEKVEVNGVVRITGTTTSNASSLTLSYTAATGASTIESRGVDTSTRGLIDFYQAASNGSLGQTAARIDASGNVGIGVSNPSSYQGNADNLVVGNLVDAGTGLTIVSGTASLGSIHFADSPTGDDSYRGFIQYNHASNYMRFATDASEAMRIDASGNVGIGVTAPAGRLHVRDDSVIGKAVFQSTDQRLTLGTYWQAGVGQHAFINSSSDVESVAQPLLFQTGGVERLRITQAGNVGIGTSSPVTPLHVIGAARVGTQSGAAVTLGENENGGEVGLNNSSNAQRGLIDFVDGDNDGSGTVRILNLSPTSGDMQIGIAAANAAGSINFFTNNSERARIDASGNLLVGQSSPDFASEGAVLYSPADTFGPRLNITNTSTEGLNINRLGTDGAVIGFFKTGVTVGSISVNGSSTFYNTSSDYRLKENVVPLAGAADRLAQIPVCRFNFIADPDKTVDGFLAHEVQAFVPEAVTGEKDAVDKDGKPVHQGIDQSKLVPLLTAALQEALQKIEALEARITALEA